MNFSNADVIGDRVVSKPNGFYLSLVVNVQALTHVSCFRVHFLIKIKRTKVLSGISRGVCH